MKKYLLAIILLVCCSSFLTAQNILKRPPITYPLVFGINYNAPWDEPEEGDLGNSRTPAWMPEISYFGHFLYFDSCHPSFTLTLFDGATSVFQAYVDAEDQGVQLPSEFSGVYELQLAASEDFYYYADITL